MVIDDLHLNIFLKVTLRSCERSSKIRVKIRGTPPRPTLQHFLLKSSCIHASKALYRNWELTLNTLQVSQHAFLMLTVFGSFFKKKKRKYNVLYIRTAHAQRNRENFKTVLEVKSGVTMSLFLLFFMLFAVLCYSSTNHS